MNLSKQGLTANSKVQVSVDDDREVKAVLAHSTGPITFFKKIIFHVLMRNRPHLHGYKFLFKA